MPILILPKPACAHGSENTSQMKRNAGIGLLALSIVVVIMTAYLMWVKDTFAADPMHHERRMRPYWLLAGLVVMLACNMFLAGVFLVQSSRSNGGRTGKTRVLALALYLAGSVNVGLFAAFLEITGFHPAGLLWPFVCQPSIIIRLFIGPMTAVSTNPVIAYTVIVLFYVIYYVCFFYPLFKRQYATMRILGAINLVLGFLILVVVTALSSME